MSFEIQTLAFRTLDMPTAAPKSYRRSLTFLYTVSLPRFVSYIIAWLTRAELSIRPDLNQQLVPPHTRATLKAKGIDIDSPNFQPMKKEDMIARLD